MLTAPLTRLGAAVRSRLDAGLWTNVYGTARSALALATLLTLATNDPAVLVADATPGLRPEPDLARYSLFTVLASHPGLARWLAVGVLAVVVVGWRPRWTAVPHAWVAVSFALSVRVIDGGDQINGIIAVLLVPVALTDRRRWHWSRPSPGPRAGGPVEVLAVSVAVVLRIQIAAIYLHACFAKLGVTEWADGTAMHYWLRNPDVGAPRWLAGPLSPVLADPWGVSALTWGALAVEFVLTCAVFAGVRWRRPLLTLGVLFHAAIGLSMGLVTFGLTMVACLILYLRPLDQPFVVPLRVTNSAVRDGWRRSTRRPRCGSRRVASW